MKILIIGGNRFFGLHLAKRLLKDGHEVTLLNRGNLDDGLGPQVQRLKADRQSKESLASAVEGQTWDIIFDQVCYHAFEARIATEVLKGKTNRYILISTESVYDYGINQPEANFNANTYRFESDALPTVDYQAAKRQVEHVFTNAAAFPELVRIRPSLVVGLDDYSGRLRWHTHRIAQSLPIYFPDLSVETDFITAAQAAEACHVVGMSVYVGPMNCTTPGSIPLREFVAMCERATGKKAILVETADVENQSPYGNVKSKTMSTDLLRSLGANFAPSADWMEHLVQETALALN